MEWKELKELIKTSINKIDLEFITVKVKVYIVEVITKHTQNESISLDIYEKYKEKIDGLILNYEQEKIKKNKFSNYEIIQFLNGGEKYIKCFYKSLKTDEEDKSEIRKIALNLQNVYKKLMKIHYNTFEDDFSILFLKEFFITSIEKITSRSGDDGIDFWGYIDNKSELSNHLEILDKYSNFDSKKIRTKIIGQAKKYSETHKVNLKEMREFIGSYYIEKTLKNNLESTILEPILGVFLTTSSYESGALNLANRTGIIALDGYDIAFCILKLKKESKFFSCLDFRESKEKAD